jgi:signal transduction histidine kinase
MSELEATAAAELTMENERLREELGALLAELRGCRKRLVEAIHAERRRIERDLHDGTQGRLVSLAMSLGFLEAKLPSDPDAARPLAKEARQAVAAALEELRELSQGIYPAALIERGLAPALEELTDRAAIPACLELSIDGRSPVGIEAAAYFVVSEALTNAVKHAHASEVRVVAWRMRGRLVVEIADDGIGGATLRSGTGLRGLSDRVEALDGRLTVASPVGRGTIVRAELPAG